MLGGPLSYLGGRYQQSPIAALLPVALPADTPAGGAFRDVPVQPILTPAGRKHPFFQGLADPAGEPPPLRVEPERVRLAPGDPIRARVRVLGEDFLPSARTELSVTLRGPGGESRALVPTLEAPGVYRIEALAAGEGSWEIAAAASIKGAIYARAAATVSVSWPLEEFRTPGLNRAALTALLAGRRGAFLELGAAGATAKTLEKALEELTSSGAKERVDTRPLAEMIPVFVALLAVLAAEWIIRRRTGLD